MLVLFLVIVFVFIASFDDELVLLTEGLLLLLRYQIGVRSNRIGPLLEPSFNHVLVNFRESFRDKRDDQVEHHYQVEDGCQIEEQHAQPHSHIPEFEIQLS